MDLIWHSEKIIKFGATKKKKKKIGADLIWQFLPSAPKFIRIRHIDFKLLEKTGAHLMKC